MIRPLRRTHRWTMLALAVVVATLFIAGLIFRPAAPSNNPRLKLNPAGGAR